jgi:hypothetical protein
MKTPTSQENVSPKKKKKKSPNKLLSFFNCPPFLNKKERKKEKKTRTNKLWCNILRPWRFQFGLRTKSLKAQRRAVWSLLQVDSDPSVGVRASFTAFWYSSLIIQCCQRHINQRKKFIFSFGNVASCEDSLGASSRYSIELVLVTWSLKTNGVAESEVESETISRIKHFQHCQTVIWISQN